ncbi:MAG: hypothetical protein ACFFCX_16185 [Candidatus Sifarchaeia archaeon]
MSLSMLESQIREVIDPQEGTLALMEIQEPSVSHILENIAVELSLRDTELFLEDNSLTITGTTDLPSISNIQVKLCFECGTGSEVESCGLYFMELSGVEGDLARDLGIAPIHELLHRFSPPSDQTGEFSIFHSHQTQEFSIKSDAGFMIPHFDMPVTDVTITVTQNLNKYGQMISSVDMHGTCHIGSQPITLGCKFPGDTGVLELRGSVPLSVDLASIIGDCLRIVDIPAPASLSDIGAIPIANISFRIAPSKRHFSAVVTTTFGEGEFVIMQKHEKDEWKEWMMILALSLDINNALDMIGAPNLLPLVSEAISNSVLVISNKSMKKTDYKYIQPLQTVDLSIDLIDGINFQAIFSDGLITDLLNIDSLNISGSARKDPLFFELLVKSTLEINIANVLFLKGFVFGITYEEEEEEPKKKNYSVKVGADIDLPIGEDLLKLTGQIVLKTKPPAEYSLALQAYMREEWIEPFGVKGITLHNLGVSLEFGKGKDPLDPVLPKYGIMGDVTIGTFRGGVAVAMKGSALNLLSIELSELNIGTIVRCLLTGIAENIPTSFFNFLDGIALEDVKFFFAHDKFIIGAITYKPGFHLKATLNFLDFRISAEAFVDKKVGMYISAAIDPINISANGFEIISLTNATDPTKGAMFELDLRKPIFNYNLVVSGAIRLLGGLVKGLADINIDSSGFNILATCNIFNLYEASLEVSGPSIAEFLLGTGEGIYLKAYMKNDLLDAVREGILKFIKDVTESAVTGMNDAKAALVTAQKDVESWDTQIRAMVEIVEREQDAVIVGLRVAQDAVTAAQNEVNKIDAQINGIYSRINTLNSQIRWWNNWYNSAPWWEKGWRWPQLLFEVGWRSAEITAHYVTIGALTVARTAAWAVLEVAKTALRIAEAVVVIVDPALDPRVVALVLARATAWTALKIAEGAVVLAAAVVSGFSSLTQFVVDWGLGKVFNITSASFEADFRDVESTSVALNADIVFIGLSFNINFEFDFNDILGSVENLALKIMERAGIEVPS